jgi:hypothetical protein
MRQNAPLTHSRPILSIELIMACATSFALDSLASLYASEFLKVVKVPGTIRNPASMIQVKALARMLWSRGIWSRCRSISIYLVWTEGTRAKYGRGGTWLLLPTSFGCCEKDILFVDVGELTVGDLLRTDVCRLVPCSTTGLDPTGELGGS